MARLVQNMPKEVHIASWEQFVAWAIKMDVGDGFATPYLFRGQENANWSLTTTLQRAATADGTRPMPSVEELLRFEDEAYRKFVRAAPTLLPSAVESSTKNLFDWWMVMQHYGAPTRLLDWSVSPFVGAYFACRAAPDYDGALYLLHLNTVNKAMETAYGENAAWPTLANTLRAILTDPKAQPILHFVERPFALPDRMLTQQGGFLMCLDPAANVEDILNTRMPVEKTPDQTLSYRKLIFPANKKPRIMKGLRSMNITAEYLFPDLDGVGRGVTELIRWLEEGVL